jgi:predicted DNA-binding antitoxin AbrB/MazE fold protein
LTGYLILTPSFLIVNLVDLKEGKKVRLFLKDEREEVLDKYAGIVKLGRTVWLKEILELGEDRWS